MTPQDLIDIGRCRALARDGGAESIRLTAGITMTEMAEAVGVSPATIWRWEKGHRHPDRRSALKYLRVLDALAQLGGHDATA